MQISGQVFDLALIKRIKTTISDNPQWSRSALARCVCQWLNWRSASGSWQEGGCRKALVELHRRGDINLPEPKTSFAPRQGIPLTMEFDEVRCKLDELGEVKLVLVEDNQSGQAKLWRGLIHTYHYLGDKSLCGAQIRYLVHSEHKGYLGALAFNSACWALAARDKFIGWSTDARIQNLSQVICNSRFLIRDGVQVPNLASHVLGKAMRCVVSDWLKRYNVKPVLVETFIDPGRFKGSSYRAANWIEVGRSAGRRDGIPKTVMVYPLIRNWQQTLSRCAPAQLCEPGRFELAGNWAEEEFGRLRVQDKRITRRLCQIAQSFYYRPQSNIPEASGSKAATMGTYRFLQNSEINMDKILFPHLESTIERIKAHPIVLAPQDTTTLNYSHHRSTEGLGPINHSSDELIGLHLHDTLAFTPSGTPLGVVDAQYWARDPNDRNKKARRAKLPIDQKESMKWLNSFRKLAEVQKHCPDTMLVSIGDREADLYELFCEALSDADNPKVLVRSERTRRRRVEDETLWQHMSNQPCAGKLSLTLPKRGNRGARTAELLVRYAQVELTPPRSKRSLPPLCLWAVHLREEVAANGGSPIEWMLLTTVPVNTFEDAVERSQWYASRWGIEVYHRTLKSGCRIKDRQLGHVKQLTNCLGIDMVIAWRLYYLTMLGREIPDHPCTAFFEEVEWKALWCYHHDTSIVPEQVPSLSDAIAMLGAMGGHLGRRSDGMPGTQVLWRAIQRLEGAIQMYIIFTRSAPPDNWRELPKGYLSTQRPP